VKILAPLGLDSSSKEASNSSGLPAVSAVVAVAGGRRHGPSFTTFEEGTPATERDQNLTPTRGQRATSLHESPSHHRFSES
jgi:hypothetical protein